MDSTVLNMVMGICAAAGMASKVEELLAEAEADFSQPVLTDVVSYNTVMKAYALCGDYPSAVKVLMRMRTRGLEPNNITYNSLLDTAARTGEAAAAWEFYQDMAACGFQGDKCTCSILIKTLSPNPTGDRILKCLDLLREVGTTCDLKLRTRLYHNVIEAALKHGDSTLLIRSFSQTQQHRVRPTAASWLHLKELADQCQGSRHKALEAAVRDEHPALGSALEEKQSGGHAAPPAAHDHDEAKAGDVLMKPQALIKPQAMQWRPHGSASEEPNWLKDEEVLGGPVATEKPRPGPAMQWRPRRV
jgi:pentatricopeptide repeat protein